MALAPATVDRATRDFAISLISDGFREAIDALPEEILNKTASELEEIRNPNEIDFFLRESLWKQIENARKL